ncbi:hypothetical protein DICPUDRAFT_77794 [Dictyostelium purpureum]|uniref:GATA-type domain-containing protein n=1 Tax=Dictyostelium purpureum TaxID=5786 RepID=F0ZHM9_DICPU|nr:uncharacterized protein DICPUDRAFT_77794 [Dictyostelium purpureum]EGC36559.1 hypothetical protein DICPUDRAFT_77794 [Dictyostelium purpureum]|eukprot:XP_003286931.1 hypothetical protein DICPUDRAFT_77794 [Dictyostelium purpureum]
MENLKEKNCNNLNVRRKVHLQIKFGNKRCKATSTVWTMGPDDCFLCNGCGQQYQTLTNIFNIYKGDIRYLVYIDPLPFITSTFMAGTSLSIFELELVIRAFPSIIKDHNNIFSFENTGLLFITDGNIFTVKIRKSIFKIIKN